MLQGGLDPRTEAWAAASCCPKVQLWPRRQVVTVSGDARPASGEGKVWSRGSRFQLFPTGSAVVTALFLRTAVRLRAKAKAHMPRIAPLSGERLRLDKRDSSGFSVRCAFVRDEARGPARSPIWDLMLHLILWRRR
jgi:hypothetical protein